MPPALDHCDDESLPSGSRHPASPEYLESNAEPRPHSCTWITYCTAPPSHTHTHLLLLVLLLVFLNDQPSSPGRGAVYLQDATALPVIGGTHHVQPLGEERRAVNCSYFSSLTLASPSSSRIPLRAEWRAALASTPAVLCQERTPSPTSRWWASPDHTHPLDTPTMFIVH